MAAETWVWELIVIGILPQDQTIVAWVLQRSQLPPQALVILASVQMQLIKSALLRGQIPVLAFNLYSVQQLAMIIHVSVIKRDKTTDRKSTRLNSSHIQKSRMPSSA